METRTPDGIIAIGLIAVYLDDNDYLIKKYPEGIIETYDKDSKILLKN